MQSSPLNISDSLLSDSDSDSTDRERLCDMSVFNYLQLSSAGTPFTKPSVPLMTNYESYFLELVDVQVLATPGGGG